MDITGANLRGMYIALSGTSAAAAITAAVAALIMEWMIVRGNVLLANGVDIKNVMVRNCRRKKKKLTTQIKFLATDHEWVFDLKTDIIYSLKR